jgi:hypothetical protein
MTAAEQCKILSGESLATISRYLNKERRTMTNWFHDDRELFNAVVTGAGVCYRCEDKAIRARDVREFTRKITPLSIEDIASKLGRTPATLRNWFEKDRTHRIILKCAIIGIEKVQNE